MATYVMRDGKLVEKHLAEPKHAGDGTHYVISDAMAPTRHMADGKYYTSKSEFRKVTKAHGCVEIGSEVPYMLKARKPVTLSRQKRREDIRRAINELRGMRS